MRQRVAIARAFANDPQILLMDEPFSALDAQNKLLLQEELLRIWEEHKKTVVFITHSVDEAVLLGDRVMVMTAQPGRLKRFVPIPLARPRDIMELQGTAGLRRTRASHLGQSARRGAARPRARRRDRGAAVSLPTGAPAVPPPRRGKLMSVRARDRILSIASPLGLLLLWELAARFGFIDTRFFPAPSSIFALLIEMLRSGELVDPYDGEPEPAVLGHADRRHSRPRARRRDGAQSRGARGVRSADRRDLSDTEELDPAAGAADLRPWRIVEDLHGGDRRVLSGRHQRHHRRARDRPDLSRRRPQLQSQPVEHVLDHRAARRAAGHHDRVQARHRHRADPHRDRRDDRRQERARLSDLECVGDLRGRADVCRPLHDRADRLRADPAAQRARTLHHPLEGELDRRKNRSIG